MVLIVEYWTNVIDNWAMLKISRQSPSPRSELALTSITKCLFLIVRHTDRQRFAHSWCQNWWSSSGHDGVCITGGPGMHTNTNLSTEELIRNHTEVSTDHMTPEIPLHLITANCALWYSKGEESPFLDPFWAFYWPGGQVLSRYILDHKHLFKHKVVLDVGCGCGASAIASKMAGARKVTANDIDTVAHTAFKLNCDLNHVKINYCGENLIGRIEHDWNVVLLGDMFYDPMFANLISDWMLNLAKRNKEIFIGDPGRLPLMEHPMKSQLTKLAEYKLPSQCRQENNGLQTGYVWKYSTV